MDGHSLDKLEFGRVRELLASHCRCTLGRQLAMAITPARKKNMIHRWLRQTQEMGQVIEHVGLPPLAGVRDIRNLVHQAVPPTRLNPEDFATIGETLAATHEARRWIDSFPPGVSTLLSVTERVVDFKFIADMIARSVDSSGQIRDDATERMARIRGAIRQATDQVGVVIGRLLRSSHVTEMLQFPNAMFHGDRMVLPLKSEHRGRLAGIIHRSSDSGATLFVEPAEVVELNNSITRLRRDEHEEVGRILFKLTQAVHANSEAILKALDAIGTLDLITAKVQMAKAYDMVIPAISDQGVLRLRAARHPVLLALGKAEAQQGLTPRPVVPIDVRLGDDFDLLIVTGPNTGGKTVALKTIGLLAMMVHAGLPIPVAEGSCVPALDDILIDVGDEQSLQQSLSTFSSHMSRILDVLRRAGKTTLVLLDELGAGTDPDEGAAIGMAVIEKLLAVGCPTMITTHLGALKSVGYTHERADNAAVEFDIASLRPTYRLLIGQPGQSNALAVARQLGMPAGLAAAAESHLSERHKTMAKVIAGTAEARRRAERAREQAEEAKVAAAGAESAARHMAEELARKQQDFQTWTQRVAHLKPGDPVKVLSFDRAGRVIRVNLAQQRAEVDIGSKAVEVPLSDLHPEDAPAPPPKPALVRQPAARASEKEKAGPRVPTNNKPVCWATSPVSVGGAPRRPLAEIHAPPMSSDQIAGLAPGHLVFVRRFQKVGRVVRLKTDKRLVQVDLGTMDAEVGFDEVCNCPSRLPSSQHHPKPKRPRGPSNGDRPARNVTATPAQVPRAAPAMAHRDQQSETQSA
jgi:DNA mismatch repair protein MutS2